MINTYEENRILGASPVELVRILYDGASQAVRDARGRLQAGDIAGRSRQISKAQMILVELSNSVDCDKGGEIGPRLVELYDYMLGRLVESHVEQIDAPLAEVGALLTTLREGWPDPEVAQQELAAP